MKKTKRPAAAKKNALTPAAILLNAEGERLAAILAAEQDAEDYAARSKAAADNIAIARHHVAAAAAVAPALKLASFTIRREGAVEWRVTGDTHCGPKSEIKLDANGAAIMPVKYTAAVTCAPSLDSRGFSSIRPPLTFTCAASRRAKLA